MSDCTCDSCGQEMKQVKLGHVAVEFGAQCRIRRFRCDLCDIEKTIYSNGYQDNEVESWLAEEEQKALYRQQDDYDKNFI